MAMRITNAERILIDRQDRENRNTLASMILDIDTDRLCPGNKQYLNTLYDEIHEWRPLADIASDIRKIANDALEMDNN